MKVLAALLLTGLLVAPRDLLAQDGRRSVSDAGHLSMLASLEGSWVGRGDGFSSTLVYEWVLPGVLLRARNEVRSDAGALIGQYEGHYLWDPGESKVVFWTVGRNGELHRGTVAVRDRQLWHEATVTGGRVSGYRSIVSVVGPELHYRAQYDPSATDGVPHLRPPGLPARALEAGRVAGWRACGMAG